jgi:hypothetical protein
MNWFIHRMLGHYLQDEANEGGGEGGGAPAPVAAPPAAAPPAAGSLLDQGASNDYIPEKFRVTGADGAVDVAQSSRKMAEAYGSLEKRLGTGDVAPKSVDEYAPKVEGVEGFNWDEFKADPDTQTFIKGAHAKGITNNQLSFVLGEYLNRAPALVAGAVQLDQASATEAMRAEWKTDAEFKSNLQASYRAAQAFGGDGEGLGSMSNLMAKYGNDPDFIAFTARIGKEMQEDSPASESAMPSQDFDAAAAELRSQLDAIPVHDPRRKPVQAKLDAMYAQRYNPKKSAFGA